MNKTHSYTQKTTELALKKINEMEDKLRNNSRKEKADKNNEKGDSVTDNWSS